MKLMWFACFSYPDVNSPQHCDDTRFSSKRLLRWTSASYQFPVLRQTLVTVEGVVDTAPVAFEGDLPPLLTAGGTLALTGGEHQVLFSPLLVLHHPDRHRQGGTVWQCDRWRLWTREQLDNWTDFAAFIDWPLILKASSFLLLHFFGPEEAFWMQGKTKMAKPAQLPRLNL